MPENIRAMWSEEELDQTLAALQPASDMDERTFGRARTELLLAAGARDSVIEEPPVRSRRRWGRWAAATATVAAVAAAVLVLQTADNLPSAAADKITSVDEPLAPGQYRYVATHAWWMTSAGKYSYLSENLLETWVPADEKEDWLQRRTVTGNRKWLSGTEAEARADGVPIDEEGQSTSESQAPCGNWDTADSSEANPEGNKKPCTTPGSWQTPNTAFMADLPRDPDQLYDRLRTDTAGRGSDENLEMLVYAADILRSGLVPADLRAALYRTLAKIPTIQITDQTANLDNQKGTAYGITTNNERQDIIIDQKTGHFIGERQITEKNQKYLPPNTTTEYTSVTTTTVNKKGETPK